MSHSAHLTSIQVESRSTHDPHCWCIIHNQMLFGWFPFQLEYHSIQQTMKLEPSYFPTSFNAYTSLKSTSLHLAPRIRLDFEDFWTKPDLWQSDLSLVSASAVGGIVLEDVHLKDGCRWGYGHIFDDQTSTGYVQGFLFPKNTFMWRKR